jgi:hypothetical protein
MGNAGRDDAPDIPGGWRRDDELGPGFGVLGPLLMTSHGVRVPVGPPTQRAVLAMLLINRNRPVSVESLINGVWDEDPVPADNDIVLDDTDVSRHHAVIADTGTGFLITDLRSTNGVEVQGERIRGSAALGDGDHIRIGNQDF